MFIVASQFFAAEPGSFAFLILPLLVAALLPLILGRLAKFDRVKEYHCGEKASFDAALIYYDVSDGTIRRIYYVFGALFVLILIAGVMV